MRTVRAALLGMLAGTVGTAALTLSNQLEQAVTGRPDSYVPARTLEGVLGLGEAQDDRQSWLRNQAWHWGFGAVVGSVRGVMAGAGLTGPSSSALFGVVRFTADEVFENATGGGSLPSTWSREEAVVDVLHKSVYALVTGAVADRLVPAR